MDLTNLNLNKDKSRKRKPVVDLSTMVYGKIPPQAREMEEVVLGAIMLERASLSEIQDLLTPEKFYLEGHQHIYRAILNLEGRGEAIDLLTVVEELKTMEKLEIVGGPYYVTKLTNSVVSGANIPTHARIIAQKWMAREVIKVGGEMVAMGYDGSIDPFDLVDEAEKGIATIMNSNDRGKIVPADTAAAQAWHRISELRKTDGALTGIPSGYQSLDRITHGWQPTDLIILAARPAVGKTAFALNLARNAALNRFKPTPSAFFSLEMSQGQLMERLISRESEVSLELIKTGRLDDGQAEYVFRKGVEPISRAPLFIDDTPALNIFELRAKCRRLKNKYGVGFFVIDYLQLMSGVGDNRNGNREQEISNISRSLKGLAKELQAPVVALSQLSRAVESRTEKTPQLSDLRESGAIEQDADMVMFLYRPEYYDIKTDENGTSTKGETHVKIAKHRNGSLETIKLTAKLDIQKFVEFEGETFTPPPSNYRPMRTPYADKDDTPF